MEKIIDKIENWLLDSKIGDMSVAALIVVVLLVIKKLLFIFIKI